MLIKLSKKAQKDIKELKKENAKLSAKLLELILDIFQHPFSGIGHPEALKNNLQGCWSRRISQKHRLIYSVEEDILFIYSCFGHYGDK